MHTAILSHPDLESATPSIVRTFDRQVPAQFLQDSIRCLQSIYAQSHAECSRRFRPTVAHDTLANLRRGDFEEAWPAVAGKYPGFTWRDSSNVGKNCYHVRIEIGQVVMTASLVDRRLGYVRPAMFRDGYARANQSYLFPEMAPTPPSNTSPIYAILSHQPNPQDLSQLMDAEFVFPDPDGRIVARIPLTKRFQYLFVPPAPTVQELVTPEPDIAIRNDFEERRNSP